MFSNSFDDFETTDEDSPMLGIPVGETLSVSGPRQSATVITINKSVERNPIRDARMLSTFLSCSLDNETIVHLAELLFAEHLAPSMKEFRETIMKEIIDPPRKRAPKKTGETKDGDTN